ncbi:MAG: ATP-dependent helicase, partial [Acidimicrobiales bacterium]
MTDIAPAVPTPEQRAAIEHPLSPLLIVAGAGTGKTFVMARRIQHLVQSGAVPGHQILGLTFTNKAAANLEAQVRKELTDDSDVTIGTYHSFGAGLVADHSLELGLAPHTRVLNAAQAWMLLFAVFDEFRFQRRSTYLPRLIVHEALQLASRTADHLVPLEALIADCEALAADGRWAKQKEAAAKRLELCQVIEAYAARKRAKGFVDFADQISLAVTLVQEHDNIAASIREQWPVVLLDEYQDTNYAQRVLLQTIWPDAPAMTSVGDDMQSIYAFRGAHLANLVDFKDHFPPCQEARLEINRRSGAAIVELANRIQAQVPGALPKTLRPMDGHPPAVIECFLAGDEAEEAETIASEIADRGAPWGANAVLCRKRRLIQPIVDALEAAGVPVDEVGGGGLASRPEIVDLVAWLEILAEPTASVALLRILQGPRYRVGVPDLAALARHARVLERAESDQPENEQRERRAVTLDRAVASFADAADLLPAARSRLAAFDRDFASLAETAAGLPVVDLCDAIAQRTGLWRMVDDKGRENLLRFLDLASNFAPVDGEPGLVAFVEYLRLLDETEEAIPEARTTDADAVRVMTIHQAKGLEFDTVYVVGLAGAKGSRSKIFPDTRTPDNPVTNGSALPQWLRPDGDDLPDWRTVKRMTDIADHLKARQANEEWRLLYVACTRAERRLVCSAAHWYAGPSEPQGPSMFYDFIAGQSDLVTERFRHDPGT